MIYIIAIIEAKPEFFTIVKSILENLVTATRQENACIKYDLHQDKKNENRFIFYEIWENQEGVDLHNKQSHMLAFRKEIQDKIQEESIVFITEKIK